MLIFWVSLILTCRYEGNSKFTKSWLFRLGQKGKGIISNSGKEKVYGISLRSNERQIVFCILVKKSLFTSNINFNGIMMRSGASLVTLNYLWASSGIFVYNVSSIIPYEDYLNGFKSLILDIVSDITSCLIIAKIESLKGTLIYIYIT